MSSSQFIIDVDPSFINTCTSLIFRKEILFTGKYINVWIFHTYLYSNQGLNIAVGLYVSMCVRVWGVYLGKKKVKSVSFAEVMS